MSISPHPQASPIEPDGEHDISSPNQSQVTGGSEVMPWPKHNVRQTATNLRTELLAKRQAVVLRVLAGFSSEPTLRGGLMAAADTLKMCFSGARVSIGLVHNDTIILAAISQQADVDPHTAESELICAVMSEAISKDHVVATTPQTLSEQGMQAHRLLCAGRPDRQLVTVPMCYSGEYIATICIERDSRVSMASSTVELVRQIGDMLAPMIQARRHAERGILRHSRDRVAHLLNMLPAPRYIKIKAIGVLLLAGLFLAYFIQTTHWVKASAELVPLERRVIAAPIDGYVQSVNTGSGDRVSVGDVLLRMDTSDANIRKASWESELNGLSTQMRAAMASADRRKMAIFAADIDKATAQLSLVETQLQRSVIVAPVDGVVVSGDLSQMVGAPVSRGQLLLELAPETGYEVHLLVDGDKISRVAVGDPAKLKLQSLSSRPIELVVDRIHPIGIAEDGANRFRVVAKIVGDVSLLMPGQTGVGKINIGEASLLQVLTEDFFAWLKLKKWEWIG